MARPGRRTGLRSLSQKYSLFTALLLSYVIFIFLAYDFWADNFNPVKATALAGAALLIAGAISRFTNRLLGRPLTMLREGITAVRHGRLEPIGVSRTGDEIEFLGESFNSMIRALAHSQTEIQQYQESLEGRIRQRTEALESASRKALAANRAKSEFLANMSHELRTPMSGVLGMLDIVIESKLDSEQRENLLMAKGCAITLLALLNDILDLSKIEAGKMVLEEIPYDIGGVAADCLRTLAPKAEAKGIELRISVDRDLPSRIAGDPLRIRQILTNLLSNAVKFTDSGWVEIRVLRNTKQEVLVEVEDTGAGIPPEKVSAIFEEFTQADGSISRRFGGTGLGLAITRRLVEMQGGKITVESEMGHGSTFRVVLPTKSMAAAEADKDAPAGASGDDGSDDRAAAPKTTILVVEDNHINQKVVGAMLRRNGYQVAFADHGGEVLGALDGSGVSLVLMDVQMPVVDGLEATRIIRGDHRFSSLPIIAMTARAMNGDRDLCLKTGMDGYISKPVNRTQLLAVVEKHLIDRARANGEVHSIEPAENSPLDVTLKA